MLLDKHLSGESMPPPTFLLQNPVDCCLANELFVAPAVVAEFFPRDG